MAVEANPYTEVYQALWRFFMDRPFLNDYIKPGNRVDFTHDNLDSDKLNEQTADWPSVSLEPTSSQVIEATSSGVIFELVLSLELHSGDIRLHPAVFPIQWGFAKAAARLSVKTLGLDYVKTVEVGEVSFEKETSSSSTKQWTSTMSIIVRFYRTHVNLAE